MNEYTKPLRGKLFSGFAIAMACLSASAAPLERYDANDDGRITKEEYYGAVADSGRYGQLDRNGNGLIEAGEFEDLDVGGEYETWDSDGDGRVDAGDFYEKAFKDADRDGDDALTQDEWSESRVSDWLAL